eukprot:1997150-Amphidinium_carterae.1
MTKAKFFKHCQNTLEFACAPRDVYQTIRQTNDNMVWRVCFGEAKCRSGVLYSSVGESFRNICCQCAPPPVASVLAFNRDTYHGQFRYLGSGRPSSRLNIF